MRHCQHTAEQMHTRTLELGYLLPVSYRRRGLHKHPGLLQYRTNVVVIERRIQRNLCVAVCIASPQRIAVPAREIDYILELGIVKAVKAIHEVGCYRQIGRKPTQRLNFILDKIDRLISYEALPREVKSHNAVLAIPGRRVYLAPVGIGMRPERRPPVAVNFIQ